MTPSYFLKDVTFSYGDTSVLTLEQLEIPDGEIVALVGPNGSGKTTLLHLLAFIERPDSGTISFFGETSRPDNALAFRRRVGLLLQRPYLFDISVAANITWGLSIRGVSRAKRGEMARSALEKVGLTGFENRDARALSGGESQRVALARSLVLDPEVLLLDEPANHMDKAGVRRTEEVFLRLNKDHGKTVIFTTHDLLSGQRLAQRVINLYQGKLGPTSPENTFRGTRVDGG